MAAGNKHYTDEERIEILKVLEANDYNFRKTHKDTGVAIKTLGKWYAKFGKEVLNPKRKVNLWPLPCTDEILKRVENKIAVYQEHWLEKVYKVRDLALKRMEELIPVTMNLDDINKTVKLLDDIGEGKISKNEGEEKGKQTFFQLINNQIISRNGDKNLTIGRDTEEHS